MNLLEILDDRRIILVGGKGGVGKTTSAAALAVRLANMKRKTLIISTDPAHSLGDAFSLSLSHKKIKIKDNLDAIELNPKSIICKHFQQIERTLSAYTRPEMLPKLQKFLSLSQHAPGAEEAAMLEAICQHLANAEKSGYEHIIFDTAPTGHTLRLLSLPEMMQAWTDGLLAQQYNQSKLRDAHNAFKNQKDNNYFTYKKDRWESAIETLKVRRQLFAYARNILHDDKKTAIVLVLFPENLPLAETKRTIKKLKAGNLKCTGLIVNQVITKIQKDPFWQQRANQQQKILYDLQKNLKYLPICKITLHNKDIRGLKALANFWQI